MAETQGPPPGAPQGTPPNPLFLERMGLMSLDELPSLAPLLPDVEGLDSIAPDEL